MSSHDRLFVLVLSEEQADRISHHKGFDRFDTQVPRWTDSPGWGRIALVTTGSTGPDGSSHWRTIGMAIVASAGGSGTFHRRLKARNLETDLKHRGC